MSNIERRLTNLEEKTWVTEHVSYIFYQLGEWMLNHSEYKSKPYYKKDKFIGPVIVYEIIGKNYTRSIDSASEEGEKLLLDSGYKRVTNDNDTETTS